MLHLEYGGAIDHLPSLGAMADRSSFAPKYSSYGRDCVMNRGDRMEDILSKPRIGSGFWRLRGAVKTGRMATRLRVEATACLPCLGALTHRQVAGGRRGAGLRSGWRWGIGGRSTPRRKRAGPAEIIQARYSITHRPGEAGGCGQKSEVQGFHSVAAASRVESPVAVKLRPAA